MLASTRSIAWLVVLALAGCGGGGSRPAQETTVAEEAPPPVARVSVRGDDEAHARVGRAGGTFELSNGMRLDIPEGALREEIELTVHVAPPAREAWDDETKRPLGPTIEVSPAIESAGAPFEVSCPANPIPEGWQPGDLALGHEEEVGDTHLGGATLTRWQMWPAHVAGSRFVAEVPYLHGHRMQFGVSR